MRAEKSLKSFWFFRMTKKNSKKLFNMFFSEFFFQDLWTGTDFECNHNGHMFAADAGWMFSYNQPSSAHPLSSWHNKQTNLFKPTTLYVVTLLSPKLTWFRVNRLISQFLISSHVWGSLWKKNKWKENNEKQQVVVLRSC